MRRRGEAGEKHWHCVDKREPGAHGSLSIVLVRLGVAKIGEDAIAREGRDDPAERDNDLRAASMVLGKYGTQILGIEPRRERRRADKTARHYGQLPTLGRWRPRSRLLLHGRAWRGPGRRADLSELRGEFVPFANHGNNKPRHLGVRL